MLEMIRESIEFQKTIYRQALSYKGLVSGIERQASYANLLTRRNQEYLNFTRTLEVNLRLFRRAVEKWPEKRKRSLQLLAEEGWFLNPEMPEEFFQETEALLEKDPEEFLSCINNYFSEQLDEIEEELSVSYPHRRHLFCDAFDAHRQEKYSLSIPVFLAQADGIFWEQFPDKNLFITRERKSAVNDYASQAQNELVRIYLNPLLLLLPLWMSEPQRNDSFSGLNRHQVLHGESFDYDTERNSLKSVSLLSYLNFILSSVNESEKDS